MSELLWMLGVFVFAFVIGYALISRVPQSEQAGRRGNFEARKR